MDELEGDGFEIGYASTVQYDFAPDVGLGTVPFMVEFSSTAPVIQ